MNASESEALFAALAECGWSWRDGFFGSRRWTIWFLSDPWMGDAEDMLRRMKDRLDRTRRAPIVDEGHVADLAELIAALERVTSRG
jgi:hypothetical protein